MAKNTDDDEATEEEGEESSGGAKKKIIKFVVLGLVGAFVAKTFFFKPPPPTDEELKATARTDMLTVWHECGVWNEVEFTDEEFEVEFEKEWASEHEPVPGEEEHAEEKSEEPAAEEGAEEDAESLGRGGLGLMARPGQGGGGAVTGPSILEVDSITINLSAGNYLKVGIALELADGADPEVHKTQGTGLDVRDMLISRLSGRAMAELQPPEVRDEILRQIGNDLCRKYDAGIKRAYFTDFVMQ
ncbi:MAG: flagellar basal body-associated FliL family protein [Actinomycetota bacterium]